MRQTRHVSCRPPASPARLLRATADTLALVGWRQGRTPGLDGRLCAYEAMELVATGRHRPATLTAPQRRALVRAAALLVAYLQLPRLNVARWNDTPGRTAAEVIGTLRDAADWYDGGRRSISDQAAAYLDQLQPAVTR